MKLDLKLWLTIALVVLVTSCGPAAKLRRAEKLINKAEELGAKWHVDTVTTMIRVPYPEVYVKEVHHAAVLDTVVIEKDRLKVKVVRLPGDSIFVEGKCAADTIIREVPVTVTKTIEAKGWLRWWMLVIAVLAGAGIVSILKRR